MEKEKMGRIERIIEEIVYRVFSEDKSVYADFSSAEEAEKFRSEDYHGPIEVIEKGEVVSSY